MTNQMIWCGYNGFNQFSSCKKLYFDEFQENEFNFITSENFDCISLWNFNAFRINNTLHIVGAISRKVEYDQRIKKISGTDEHILILLENGDVYRFVLDTQENIKLTFLGGESPEPIDDHDDGDRENVIDIACGIKLNIAITNKNSFYTIPMKCFDFPKQNKIKQICCGNEHAAILNTNGDVYVWGSGLRGQHGNGEVSDLSDTPQLIEALAGIKIVEIACGGWHIAAISSFNDLYVWGWNSHGQLGHGSVVTSIPTLVDFDDINILHVSCGLRHTVVQTENGKLLSCGWNKYGQLGVPVKAELEEKKFTEITLDASVKVLDYKLKCGSWSTFLIKS